jgi:hypothetical protein
MKGGLIKAYVAAFLRIYFLPIVKRRGMTSDAPFAPQRPPSKYLPPLANHLNVFVHVHPQSPRSIRQNITHLPLFRIGFFRPIIRCVSDVVGFPCSKAFRVTGFAKCQSFCSAFLFFIEEGHFLVLQPLRETNFPSQNSDPKLIALLLIR